MFTLLNINWCFMFKKKNKPKPQNLGLRVASLEFSSLSTSREGVLVAGRT